VRIAVEGDGREASTTLHSVEVVEALVTALTMARCNGLRCIFNLPQDLHKKSCSV
jgi:hypothetical protein